MKVNLGEIWPKATGLTENPVLDIHITLWRKTKVILGISALKYVESNVAQYTFQKNFLKKYAWKSAAIFFRTIIFLKNLQFS